MNFSHSKNEFCHDKMEKDSNCIEKSTQILTPSKRSSSLSDVTKDAPQKTSKNIKNSQRKEILKKSERRLGRKPENLGLKQRKNVVLKTLLRKMRTWFWNDFTFFTCFETRKDVEDAVVYGEWLKKYSSEKFSSNKSQTFLFYLSNLMSSKSTEQQVSSEHGLFYEAEEKKRSNKFNKVRNFHGLLYKFSYKKLKNLLKNKDL
jgi:hypothetical protein